MRRKPVSWFCARNASYVSCSGLIVCSGPRPAPFFRREDDCVFILRQRDRRAYRVFRLPALRGHAQHIRLVPLDGGLKIRGIHWITFLSLLLVSLSHNKQPVENACLSAGRNACKRLLQPKKCPRGRASRARGGGHKKTAGKGPPQRFVFHFFASALPAPGVRAEKREKREDLEAPEQHVRREHEL